MADRANNNIKAAIFDMDGVLIDSEPFWQEAEIIAFGRVGVELTPEMCKETMGLRVDEVVRIRYEQFGWSGKTQQQVQDDILAELRKLILAKGKPMAGVGHVLDFFKQRGIRLALASSTHMRIIETVLQKLNLTDEFEVVHSAEFEPYGKPHPGIYLTTLQKLDLSPDDAIAFEDSLNGVIAAKAARLRTIAIPEESARHDTRFDIADMRLNSLTEFSEERLGTLLR